MRSIGHPDFEYRPWSDERRQERSDLVRRRMAMARVKVTRTVGPAIERPLTGAIVVSRPVPRLPALAPTIPVASIKLLAPPKGHKSRFQVVEVNLEHETFCAIGGFSKKSDAFHCALAGRPDGTIRLVYEGERLWGGYSARLASNETWARANQIVCR